MTSRCLYLTHQYHQPKQVKQVLASIQTNPKGPINSINSAHSQLESSCGIALAKKISLDKARANKVTHRKPPPTDTDRHTIFLLGTPEATWAFHSSLYPLSRLFVSSSACTQPSHIHLLLSMMSLFSNLKGFMSPSKPSSANGDNHLNNEDKMSRGLKRKADPYDLVDGEG